MGQLAERKAKIRNKERRLADIDALQFHGVIFGGIETSERNSLIIAQPVGLVDQMGIELATLEIGLGADDEKSSCNGECVQSVEVQIATVHDVEGARFQQ